MQEQAGTVSVEEEAENFRGGFNVEIESAIHELELPAIPVEEALHGGKETVARKVSDGCVERGETEVAAERATARGFDIDDPVGNIVVSVEIVGQGDVK